MNLLDKVKGYSNFFDRINEIPENTTRSNPFEMESEHHYRIKKIVDTENISLSTTLNKFREIDEIIETPIKTSTRTSMKETLGSNLNYAVLDQIINELKSKLMKVFFGNMTVVKYRGLLNQDQLLGKITTKATKIYMNKIISDIKTEVDNTFHDACRYGTGVIKIGFDKHSDNLVIKNRPIQKICVDTNVDSEDDIRYLIDHIEYDKEELKQLFDSGFFNNSENLNFTDLLVEDNYDYQYITVNNQYVEDKYLDKILFKSVYTFNRIDGVWERTITTYNGHHILDTRVMQDGIPYIFFKLKNQNRFQNKFREEYFTYNSVYGSLFYESAIQLQASLNFQANGLISIMKKNLKPRIFFKGENAGMSNASYNKDGAGAFIKVKGDFQVEQQVSNVGEFLALMDKTKQNIRELTGVKTIDDTNSALFNRQTDSNAELISSEMNILLSSYISNISNSGFVPMFQRIAHLVLKYGKNEKAFENKILNSEKVLETEKLQDRMNGLKDSTLEVVLGANANSKDRKIANLKEMLQMFSDDQEIKYAIAYEIMKEEDLDITTELFPEYNKEDNHDFLKQKNILKLEATKKQLEAQAVEIKSKELELAKILTEIKEIKSKEDKNIAETDKTNKEIFEIKTTDDVVVPKISE